MPLHDAAPRARLPQPAVIARGAVHAGQQQNQLRRIASVQRQFANPPLVDYFSQRGRLRLYGADVRRHVDALRQASHVEHDVDAGSLIDGKRDARLCHRLEALFLNADAISPWGKQRGDIVAEFVCLCFPADSRLLIRKRDARRGHNSVGLVGDSAGNLRVALRRQTEAAGDQDHG